MTTASKTHDILLSYGSTEQKFMLVRDKNGRVMFSAKYAPSLSPQMFTSDASYANSPPEIEKVVAQEDWRAGMGEVKYDNPKRYALSINADARFKGKIVLGPLAYTLTTIAAGTPALQNIGMESGVYAWRSAGATGTLVEETSIVQAGSKAVKVSVAEAGAGARQILWMPCSVNGQTITFSIYGRAEAAGKILRTEIYEDGVLKDTTNTTMTDADTWYQSTVDYTGVSSTTCYIEVKATCTTADFTNFYLDTATLTFSGSVAGPALGNPKDFKDFNSKLYMLSDTGLWEFDSATPDWHWVVGSPANGERLESWGDYLFIARGETRAWWAWDKYGWRRYGTSYGTDTAIGTDGYANFFLTIGADLYKAYKPNTIAAATAPLAGSWASVTVGESGYNITGLAMHRGDVYIGKENGLYKLTDSTATEIGKQLRSLYNTASGKNLMEWGPYLYIPMGAQSLYQYDGGGNDFGTISPAQYSPGIQEYSGQIEALAGDEAYLYAFVTGLSNKCELLAGRYEDIDGSVHWVWHPIYELAAASVETAHISSVTSPSRLWFITTTSIKYLILPSSYADITQATGYKCAASGEFYTGNFDFGFVDQLKALAYLTSTFKNLQAASPARTIAVSFQDDDDGTWTSLGTLNSTTNSQTLYFPVNTTGKRFKLKLAMATADADQMPQLLSYALHGIVAFTRKRFFQFMVQVEDNVPQLNAKPDLEARATKLAGLLRYFGDQPYVAMKLLDDSAAATPSESETTYYVHILDIAEEWQQDEVTTDTTPVPKRPARIFTVTAVEVKLS